MKKLGDELDDSRADSILGVDGKKYPIFSRHGDEGDLIHCNICDVVFPTSKEVFHEHVESASHQLRFLDEPKARSTLMEYVNMYGVEEVRTSIFGARKFALIGTSYADDAAPPGCEDVVSRPVGEARLMFLTGMNVGVACLGLEYIVEITADRDIDYMKEPFYFCGLCDRRCEATNVVFHIQSSPHRMRYLEKFCPRAFSIFLQQLDVSNWSPAIHQYLGNIAWRIESIKGILKPTVVRRSHWDMRAAQIKSELEYQTHITETPDIVYGDIPCPFAVTPLTLATTEYISDGVFIQSVPVRAGSVPEVDSRKEVEDMMVEDPDLLPVKNEHHMDDEEVKKTRQIIQREIERFRTTYNYKDTEVVVPRPSTSTAESTSDNGDGLAAKKEELAAKLAQLRQDVMKDANTSVYYEKAKQQIHGKRDPELRAQPKRDDDEILIEKEVIKRRSRSRGRSRRKHRRSRSSSYSSRSRSRSHSRSRSRSRSRSPSRSRHHRNRDQHYPRGRFQRHGGPYEDYGRPPRPLGYLHGYPDRPPHFQRGGGPFPRGGFRPRGPYRADFNQGYYHQGPRGPYRPDFDLEYHHEGPRGRPPPPPVCEETTEELWDKLERELSVLEETQRRKRHFHEKRPEDHPKYEEEWKIFWEKRYHELKAEGKDPAIHDFKPEWIIHWQDRMRELDKLEIEQKKEELKRKYGLDTKSDADSDRSASSPTEESRKPVKFSWKKTSDQPDDDTLDVKLKTAKTSKESVDERTLIKNPSPPHPAAEVPADAEAISSPEAFENNDEDSRSLASEGRESGRFRSNYPGRNYPHGGSYPSGKLLSSRRGSHRGPGPRGGPWYPDRSPSFGSSYRERSSSARSLSPTRDLMEDREVRVDILHVLRLLAALEDNLGSLGPTVNSALARALAMERTRPGAAAGLLEESSCVTLLDTAKEKLKGQLVAGILDRAKSGAARVAIDHVTQLLEQAPKMTDSFRSVPGVAAVRQSSAEEVTAQQIANVLLTQGKANISDAELQQIIASLVQQKSAGLGAAATAAATFAAALPHAPQQPVVPTPAAVAVVPLVSNNAPPSAAAAAQVIDTNKLLSSLAAAGLIQLPAAAPQPAVPVAPEPRARSTSETHPAAVAAPQTAAAAASSKNSSMDDFTMDELKMLIFNFKNLTSAQQQDLVTYLKKLETTNPDKVKQLRQAMAPTSSSRPAAPQGAASPLSKKYHNIQTGLNPSAPDVSLLDSLMTNPSQEGPSPGHPAVAASSQPMAQQKEADNPSKQGSFRIRKLALDPDPQSLFSGAEVDTPSAGTVTIPIATRGDQNSTSVPYQTTEQQQWASYATAGYPNQSYSTAANQALPLANQQQNQQQYSQSSSSYGQRNATAPYNQTYPPYYHHYGNPR